MLFCFGLVIGAGAAVYLQTKAGSLTPSASPAPTMYSMSDIYNKTAGCYVSYSGSCLSGFSNLGSVGTYGSCDDNGSLIMFRPVGATCGGRVTISTGWGTGYACCR